MIHHRTLQSLEFPRVVALLTEFCLSPQGKALASRVAPFRTEAEAREALMLYEDSCVWAADPMARRGYTDGGFPDITPLLEACEKQRTVLDTDSFWALRVALNAARSAVSSIVQENGESRWPTLYAYASRRELPGKLTAALNRCISDDALIRDESSPELFRLRSEIRSLHQNCLHRVHEFAAKFNIASYLQEEFMTISQDRYVLPLKATYKGRLQGILHDWSQTGETCYFEPMFLVELNNRLQELRREEREEEVRILDYLGSLVREDPDAVRHAVRFLSILDLLQAKRRFADLISAETVFFTPQEEGIELLKARHPLLAARAAKESASGPSQGQPVHPSHPVHPLDIIFRRDDQCLLITGGNAGGKTVCLKTLGLIVAMAASGLAVPCARGSHLFFSERMDAFIGDEQDLDDNVSTFTAQIEHLAKAWKHLGRASLVLLDEFGAGTDPTHGAALAQAVLDSLLERGAYVLAATHFPTLKIWALSTEKVRAASMLFDPESRRPLYTLAYDQVGASQTLDVAREHGLPAGIIARAEKYLLLTQEDSTKQLDRLNALAVAREAELTELKRLQDRTRNDLQNRKEKLDRERARLEHEVAGKIKELMQGWKSEKTSARQALSEMKRLRSSLRTQPEEQPGEQAATRSLESIAIGSRVRHRGLNKYGTVIDRDERKNRVRLDLGGISLWASLSDLTGEAVDAPKKAVSHVPHPRADEGFSLTLDLRGYTVELALAELERFLDRTMLSGLSSVDIVHGRGTGVLRREIHEYLKSYPGVDHFSLAPEDQGGDGKTIVYFR